MATYRVVLAVEREFNNKANARSAQDAAEDKIEQFDGWTLIQSDCKRL